MTAPSWVRVGAKCRCVRHEYIRRSDVQKSYARNVPVFGGEYTVREVQIIGDNTGILLVEIVNPKVPGDVMAMFDMGTEDEEICWNVVDFRPIIDIADDVAIFTHMLITERQPEDA